MENNNFTFDITDSAVDRILKISKDNDGILRIRVKGGGCSGFSYEYDISDKEKKDDDFVLKKVGISVLIDSVSQNFLDGSVLNFVNDLGNSYFEIKNPNAKSKCGCGNSFDVG